MKTHFKLFSSCIPVKGVNRSLIYDLERKNLELIPLSLHDILIQFNNKVSISNLIISYGKENESIINGYLDFLIKNEFGFLCNIKEFDMFPEINMEFKTPMEITNCIIELNDINQFKLNKIKTQLEKFNCETVNIVAYFSLTYEDFKFIFDVFRDSKIKSIEIVTKFSIEYDVLFLKKIKLIQQRLTKLIIHSCSQVYELKYIDFLFQVITTPKIIDNFKHCGNISIDYFKVHKTKFVESYNFNSCLNKKISIDINGNIKNCPALSQTYGNIKNTNLEEALNHIDFKKYWSISKDKISICKDCEFRHVCTDCRAFLENPKDIYSKPLKCGYNPYNNKWDEWSSNPLKKKSIKYYQLKDLV